MFYSTCFWILCVGGIVFSQQACITLPYKNKKQIKENETKYKAWNVWHHISTPSTSMKYKGGFVLFLNIFTRNMFNTLIYSKRDRNYKVTDINSMGQGVLKYTILRVTEARTHNVLYGTPWNIDIQ